MKTIRIYAKEIILEKDGKKKTFLDFSYVNNKGVFYKVKFKKECELQPRTKGYHLITFDLKDISIQKKKANEVYKPNDIMWVAHLSETKQDVEYAKEREQILKQEIENIFEE